MKLSGIALRPVDELEIRALISRYHDTTNYWDPAAWGALWARDAIWHAGTWGTTVGREAIVALREQIMAMYGRQLIQMLLHGRVWAADDGPRGRWTFLEIARKCGHHADHIEIQCATDRYGQRNGQWQLIERSVQRVYRNGINAGEFFGFPPIEQPSRAARRRHRTEEVS